MTENTTPAPDPRAHITGLLATDELPDPIPLGEHTREALIEAADEMFAETRTEVDDATSATQAATIRGRLLKIEQLVTKLGGDPVASAP